MFNPLAPDELILAVGSVLNATARSEGALDGYQRSQLLSAYSITRLLAAEQLASAHVLAWLREALLEALSDEHESDVVQARGRIEHATAGSEIGEALADLLQGLRERPRPQLREHVHRVLREMSEMEVAALSARPDGSKGTR